MLEMSSVRKYVDLYLTSEWGRFYVGHPVVYCQYCHVFMIMRTMRTAMYLCFPAKRILNCFVAMVTSEGNLTCRSELIIENI
jgi:hypothetical protein